MIRLLRTYLAPYHRWLLAVVVFQAIQAVASLFLPSLNASIIDDGVIKGDTGYIWRTGAIMLGVTAVQAAFAIVAVYCAARLAMGFGRDVRTALFRRVIEFSAREVNSFGAPSLITRITNDVQQVQMLVITVCTMVVAAPITVVFGVIMAMRQDLGMSWLLGISLPLLVIILTVIVSRMIPQFRLMQERLDSLNGVLRAQIVGMRVVRAFVREPVEEQRFHRVNDELTHTSLVAGRLMALMFPTMFLIVNASSVAVIWIGGHRVDTGTTSIGSLVAFLTYLTLIMSAVMMATMGAMMAPRAAVSAERIQDVLDTFSSVVPPANPVRSLAVRGKLELRDVSFHYPGAEHSVLSHISLTCLPGQTTAIVGSTGAGKTSLINVAARLFDVTSGAVLFDDVDVRELDPEILWHRIGIVPQRAYLFAGTVASNLRYGKPGATEDEIWAALEVAQAADFVRAMPGGLEAPIVQGGLNVSGGQRQRLAIARALVRKPEIYLFDDSFSALDLATDARLRAALQSYARDATVLIVAQRFSSIMHADQILVLDDGEMVGLGTHEELLETCPTYAEIVESQLGEGQEVPV
ncbi:MAG: ABC transporter ATP-binding protein/permease [Dehalococcoidia bacterium]|nr:ABC transporter ATP-binding protein/permease [Dehalococcoidia bacterium]